MKDIIIVEKPSISQVASRIIIALTLVLFLIPKPYSIPPILPEVYYNLSEYSLKLQGKVDLIREYEKAHLYKVRATAYTARREETNEDPTNTAIMETPKPGWTIAVSHDLKHLLGKKVYVYGLGVRRVNDLMNQRFDNHIDILVGTVPQARAFGVQHLEMVYLPEETKKWDTDP